VIDNPTPPHIRFTVLYHSSSRREADNSPPSSAEVKNAWSYNSTPPICLHGVVLSESTGTTLPLP
jgi:hypothetical protein